MTQEMKILIAYDGSESAEAVLDDLQRAGLPHAAETLVMCVAEISPFPSPPSSFGIIEQTREVHAPAHRKRVHANDSVALEHAQSLAALAVVRLRANFPSWKIAAAASVGSPYRELIMKADEWQPDLIVAGTHGRSTFGRLVLGSVSQGLLTHARCSVRVARSRIVEPDTPVRIVVGVDGSPASAAAVREVEARAWPSLSEVRIVAVNDPLTPTFVGRLIPPVAKTIEESNRADRELLRKAVDECSVRLRNSGLKSLTEIREGDPKRLLVESAKEWGADCIFVGSIGFGNPLERFVLGSVSASVAARAHCSVEVVRPRNTNGDNHNERATDYQRN